VFHNRFRYATRRTTDKPGELASNAGEGIIQYYKKKDIIDIVEIEVEQELREACLDMKKRHLCNIGTRRIRLCQGT
jgi:hypothetical protein